MTCFCQVIASAPEGNSSMKGKAESGGDEGHRERGHELVYRQNTSRPVFRLKAWKNIAQGKPLRRRPGFAHRHSLQSVGLRAVGVTRLLSGFQPFSLNLLLPVDPGRRRKASSPWAKFSQAFSLKIKPALRR